MSLDSRAGDGGGARRRRRPDGRSVLIYGAEQRVFKRRKQGHCGFSRIRVNDSKYRIHEPDEIAILPRRVSGDLRISPRNDRNDYSNDVGNSSQH